MTACALTSICQRPLKDFQGTWVDQESGWWMAMNVKGNKLDMYQCYDGKTLPGVSHYFAADTLVLQIGGFDTNTRTYKVWLSSKEEMKVFRDTNMGIMQSVYRRSSRRFRSAENCYLN